MGVGLNSDSCARHPSAGPTRAITHTAFSSGPPAICWHTRPGSTRAPFAGIYCTGKCSPRILDWAPSLTVYSSSPPYRHMAKLTIGPLRRKQCKPLPLLGADKDIRQPPRWFFSLQEGRRVTARAGQTVGSTMLRSSERSCSLTCTTTHYHHHTTIRAPASVIHAFIHQP